MVETRSARKPASQNVHLTSSELEVAQILVDLKYMKLPRKTKVENIKLGVASGYNLRSRRIQDVTQMPKQNTEKKGPAQAVTPQNYNKWDDWDCISDPTWTPRY